MTPAQRRILKVLERGGWLTLAHKPELHEGGLGFLGFVEKRTFRVLLQSGWVVSGLPRRFVITAAGRAALAQKAGVKS